MTRFLAIPMGWMFAVACAVALTMLWAAGAFARDGGDWSDTPPADHAWLARQTQPDNPGSSCCGPADAYQADKQELTTDELGVHVIAIITDTRDDVKLNRPHIPVGTRVKVPDWKVADPRRDPNLTDHGWLFLSGPDTLSVYCYFNPPGGG